MAERYIDDWIQEYIEYTAFSEAPTSFHFWTAVSVIAGALRRRVWIDQRYFQWTPNFYIFFVAPPGIVSKSTTADIGMRILRQVKGINFGAESLTWQALVRDMAAASENVVMEDGLVYPMSCITVAISELGTFYNPDDREQTDMLVNLWDSRKGPFERSTKTQGKDLIENPWLNLIGCTTPAWISKNVPEYMIGGGLHSRSIFVYADKKRQYTAYINRKLDLETERAFSNRLLHDLRIISTIKGEYKITEEAMDWGEIWYRNHWENGLSNIPDANPERYGGYIARKQTHIHKLAMVLTAARTNARTIDLTTLQKAEQIISTIERDMGKVFGNIGLTDSARLIRELIAYVRALKAAPKSQLWRLLMHQMGREQVFNDCLQAAMSARYIGVRAGKTNEPEYFPLEQKHE